MWYTCGTWELEGLGLTVEIDYSDGTSGPLQIDDDDDGPRRPSDIDRISASDLNDGERRGGLSEFADEADETDGEGESVSGEFSEVYDPAEAEEEGLAEDGVPAAEAGEDA